MFKLDKDDSKRVRGERIKDAVFAVNSGDEFV